MIQTLVVGKMKHKTAGVAIKEFIGLKPKMYSFLVDDSSEHKKAKVYKDVLLNNKCLRHSINRTQSKIHRIGIYEIRKILLSCFDDKIHTLNNG